MPKYIPLKIPVGSITPFLIIPYTKLDNQYMWVANESGENMPNITITREKIDGIVTKLWVNVAPSIGGLTTENVYFNISK